MENCPAIKSFEVVKRYNPRHIIKLLGESQDGNLGKKYADIFDNQCPTSTPEFTNFIDALLIAAVANKETDTIDGIIFDLNYANEEIKNAIATLKKIKKA